MKIEGLSTEWGKSFLITVWIKLWDDKKRGSEV